MNADNSKFLRSNKISLLVIVLLNMVHISFIKFHKALTFIWPLFLKSIVKFYSQSRIKITKSFYY